MKERLGKSVKVDTKVSEILYLSASWIVLDALDECKTRGGNPAPGLLTWLEHLHLRQKSLDLLVTSRPEDDVRSAVSGFAGQECILILEKELISGDINNVIHEQVRGERDFQETAQSSRGSGGN